MNTRTVTVIDRALQRSLWGHGSVSIQRLLKTVTLNWDGRNEPELRAFHEDGETYAVHCWSRKDGKTDMYPKVLEEARNNGLNEAL